MTTLTTQLEQLENAQLVRRLSEEELAYLFKHALTQESAYGSLLMKKRREIHRLVGEAYEVIYAGQLDEYVALLTQHFAQAGDDAKTVEYAARAGNRAYVLYAYPEARGFFTLALDTLKRLPETVTNRRRRIDVTLQYVAVSQYAESLESNLARLAEIEPLARNLPGDGTPGGDALRLARVHYHRGHLYTYQNKMREAVAEFEQVLPVAREFGDQEMLLMPSAVIGHLLTTQGRFARAQELLEPVVLPLEQAGVWDTWGQVAGATAFALSARGHLVQARELVDRVMARSQVLESAHHIALAHLILTIHLVYGGEWQQAIQAANETIELARSTGDLFVQYGAIGWRCWAEAGLGDYRAASKTYSDWEALAAQFGNQIMGTEPMQAVHAWIALLAGDIDNALALAEQTATLARKTDSLWALGLAERVWGQALARCNPPRWDEAEAQLAASLHAFEEGDAVLEAARTRVAWGKTLAQRGHTYAARAHFEQAGAQFRASGLTGELEQTQQLMVSLVG